MGGAMPLDKPCVAPGCRAQGVHGRGSLRKDTLVWACPAHKHLIGVVVAVPSSPPRDGGRGGARRPPSRGGSGPAQGRLFG